VGHFLREGFYLLLHFLNCKSIISFADESLKINQNVVFFASSSHLRYGLSGRFYNGS